MSPLRAHRPLSWLRGLRGIADASRTWRLLPGPARIAAGCVAVGALAFAGQASFSASTPSTYVVRSGDSLWSIARTYHVTVSQLATANGVNPGALLLTGKHLTIPGAGSAGGRPTASVGSATAASSVSAAPSSASAASFCSTLSVAFGPTGVLPASLAANPTELALRPYFVTYAERYGVSPALAEAIAWQESGWQEGEVSSAQAVGVGQLLPATAQFVSQGLLGSNLNIASAADNIRMEVRYLAYLQSALGGRCATIAGYYEGLQNMQRYGVLNESRPYVASVEALIPRFG